MQLYGSNISFSMVGAPTITGFTGIGENFSYALENQLLKVPSDGNIVAVVEHSQKGNLSFSVAPAPTITSLMVRAGAELTISSISAGTVICNKVSAKWQRGQKMIMDCSGIHYPLMTGTPSGTLQAGAITLANGNGTGYTQLPTGTIWYSVDGITPVVAGIVQSLSISESVQIQEEEGSGTQVGEIVAAVVHSYEGMASMEVLTSGALPALGSTMTAFGGFRVKKAEFKNTQGSLRNMVVEGYLIPGVTGS